MRHTVGLSLLTLTLLSCGGPTPTSDGGMGGMGGSSGTTPDTTITSRPTAPISGSAMATFAFTSDSAGATFECQWDSEAFSTCTSPASRGAFSNGAHTFSVRALNNGLTDDSPATASFEVDALGPSITIGMKPAASQSNAAPATFVFTCSDTTCVTECSLDGAAFSACSSPANFDVAAGRHTLSIRGTDSLGNVGAPAMHSWEATFGWRSVAIGAYATCGITGDRKLYCWGANVGGVLGLGLPLTNAAPVSTPTRVGTATNWDRVRAGDALMCAVNTSGAESCWGSNAAAQFGDPSIANTQRLNAPLAVARTLHDVSFGNQAACAIDAMGALFCWGEGSHGTLGDGNIASHQVATPTRLGSATWRNVSVGEHACGVQLDGSLWCWGPNSSGECGLDPMTEEVARPNRVGVDTDWASVSASSGFTCALKTTGAVHCWGFNGDGRLGIGSTTDTIVPTRVGGMATFSSVRAMSRGACAVKSDNSLWCWGTNDVGELGTQQALTRSLEPVAVSISEPVKAIVGSRNLRCALTMNDQLQCWGDNANGGLGRGVNGSEPELVSLDTGWSEISIVSNFQRGTAIGGCGLKSGALWCWGTGRHVGLPNTYQALQPTRIGTASDWTKVRLTPHATTITGNGQSQLEGHACGLRGAALYCWGVNTNGQIGQGMASTEVKEPTLVPAPSGELWRDFAVGSINTCAITVSNKLFCWGDNTEGQLGNAMSGGPDATVPTQVQANESWQMVDLSDTRLTGLMMNRVWTWGFASANQPSSFDMASDFVEVRAGGNYSCGRKMNGTVHCRTLSFPITQVLTFSDVTKLLNFSDSMCLLRGTGQVTCVQSTGASGPFELATNPVAPTGDWVDFQFNDGFSCGLKAGGQRFCKGTRFAGAFGDGVDTRTPAAVLTPM